MMMKDSVSPEVSERLSRLTRRAQTALIELDLAAHAAIDEMNAYPEHVSVMHRLIGRLGVMHSVLTRVVKLMTEEVDGTSRTAPDLLAEARRDVP